jgi:hypothetical protein
MSHNGKVVLKEEYVQALFSAVRSGYKISDTRAKESVLEAWRVFARQ